MSDEGFFKINQDTEFKFKDSYGFTFVFEENILRINEKISSAELKPIGIIYEENGEYYLAPLDEAVNIHEIVKEFVKKCI